MAKRIQRVDRRILFDSEDQSQYYMSGANATMLKNKPKTNMLNLGSRSDKKKQHAVRRKDKPWPKLPIFALIFVLALLVVGEFALVQSMGLSVSQAQTELRAIEAQNESLRNNVSELSSLSRVEQIATQDMGMVKPEQTYTYIPTPIAEEASLNTPLGQ